MFGVNSLHTHLLWTFCEHLLGILMMNFIQSAWLQASYLCHLACFVFINCRAHRPPCLVRGPGARGSEVCLTNEILFLSASDRNARVWPDVDDASECVCIVCGRIILLSTAAYSSRERHNALLRSLESRAHRSSIASDRHTLALSNNTDLLTRLGSSQPVKFVFIFFFCNTGFCLP